MLSLEVHRTMKVSYAPVSSERLQIFAETKGNTTKVIKLKAKLEQL